MSDRREAERTAVRDFADTQHERQIFDAVLSQTRAMHYVFDRALRFVYVNEALAQSCRLPADAMIGRGMVEAGYPAQLVRKLEQQLRGVLATGRGVQDRVPVDTPAGPRWHEYALDPLLAEDGGVDAVTGTTFDVTDQVRAEEALAASRQRAIYLSELGNALRSLDDPADIEAAAASRLARMLGVPRAYYAEANSDGQHVTVHRDFADGVASIAGRHRLEDFGQAVNAALRTGRTIVVDRILDSPTVDLLDRAAYESLGIGAFIAVPLAKNARFVAVLTVTMPDARAWTPHEVGLVEDTAEQTWATIERARAEAALRRAQVRAEALLRLSDRLARLADPDELAYDATRILGETLGVDRCGYGTIDKSDETITIARDWNAAGIRTLAGTLHFREHGSYIEDLKRGDTVVVSDSRLDMRTAATTEVLERINARAFVNMPVTEEGNFVALLYLNHGRARPWSVGDLDFMRDVAQRVRSATERRRAEIALREAENGNARLVEELRQADRRKNEFLATLAHELRNPLAPMRSGLALMGRPELAPAAARDARAVMERQLAQMVRLIDDLMDVSRISRGRIELRRALVPLGDAIARAVEAARPQIDAAGHRFEVGPAPDVMLDADPVRLAQVFTNLLNNAAKFTDPGGSIGLRMRVESPFVAVDVVDNGIGISDTVLPNLFELFMQGDGSLEKRHQGLGIGLSLVRGIVALHGGTVSATSDGPGMGSRFTARLPIAATSPDVSAADTPSNTSDAPTVTGGAAISDDATLTDDMVVADDLSGSPGRRVLIADDNRDAAESLGMLLEAMGHEVRLAHDGDAAVTLAGDFSPHFALLDIGMPVLNGYDTCRRMRAEPWGGAVTIIACTGWGQDEDRRHSADAGFDHHLVKPIEPEALFALLDGALRNPPPG